MQLHEDRKSHLFDSHDLRLVKPLHVHGELQRLAVQETRKPMRLLFHQLTCSQAVTL
jgi:hypothetical protein